MQNITIGRFEKDDTAQGAITPGDKSWQLVIDKDGFPHLYVAVNIRSDAGELTKGMVCVEDFLIEKLTIRDLMSGGEFGGELVEDEEEAAHAEYLASREATGIPCPRI